MTTYTRTDQRGMVSFMITLIMMLVISLIVIGFTQVTNRNRREQLDRQLSMQAFYAAESGINAATDIIAANIATPPKQDTCDGTDYPATSLHTNPNVAYTCVLVDPTTPDIRTNASPQKSAVFPLHPVDTNGNPVTLDTLIFSWSVAAGQVDSTIGCSSTPTGTFLPSSSYSCRFGILRVDLVQDPNSGGSLDANALNNKTTSLFLQPSNNGSPTTTLNSFATKGLIVGARHVNGMYTVTLNLGAAAQSNDYYMRIVTLYRDAPDIIISGKHAGSAVQFKDAQAVVDVTGKAVDTLRRIQVRVPLQLRDTSLIPEGAVQSAADVCKRFATYDGYFNPTNGAEGCHS